MSTLSSRCLIYLSFVWTIAFTNSISSFILLTEFARLSWRGETKCLYEQVVPNLQKPSWKKYLQGTGCLAVHDFWSQCESKQVSCVWKCLQDERNLQWPDWWNLQTAWGSLSIFNLNLSLLTSLLWCRSVDGCACFLWEDLGEMDFMVPGLLCEGWPSDYPHTPGSHQQSSSPPSVKWLMWRYYISAPVRDSVSPLL